MITSILKGGLGNQMFQYAVGRSLALAKDVDLALETSHFGIEKIRSYKLNCFAINISLVSVSLPQRSNYQLSLSNDTLDRISKPHSKTILSIKYNFINEILPHRLINHFLPLHKKYYYLEKQYNFDELLFSLGDEVVLDGYWQSEKYFKNIEHIIRQDFCFCSIPSKRNQSIIDRMLLCNAISLHVRRGDYISNAEVNTVHGVCNTDYYQAAIKFIKGLVQTPHFFVFSDDISWCQENLTFSETLVTFIEHNQGEKSHEDMRLMSYCKHHIIANSSFSWWGAWLNPSLDKIVIAPKRWFAKSTINMQDVVPDEWIRL